DRLARRQPGRRAGVRLGGVGPALDREEVEGVVGELPALALRPARGAHLPAVGERHDVVYLDLGGLRLLPGDVLAGVRVVQVHRHDRAVGAAAELDVAPVQLQQVVAGVAPVPGQRHTVGGVHPGVAELVAGVAGLRAAALGRHLLDEGGGLLAVGAGHGGGAGAGAVGVVQRGDGPAV